MIRALKAVPPMVIPRGRTDRTAGERAQVVGRGGGRKNLIRPPTILRKSESDALRHPHCITNCRVVDLPAVSRRWTRLAGCSHDLAVSQPERLRFLPVRFGLRCCA